MAHAIANMVQVNAFDAQGGKLACWAVSSVSGENVSTKYRQFLSSPTLFYTTAMHWLFLSHNSRKLEMMLGVFALIYYYNLLHD